MLVTLHLPFAILLQTCQALMDEKLALEKKLEGAQKTISNLTVVVTNRLVFSHTWLTTQQDRFSKETFELIFKSFTIVFSIKKKKT